MFSSGSHCVPNLFLLVLAMFPNIFSIAPVFYPICFGKCCLVLTGPAPCVLLHINHMQICFSFFFCDTQCVSLNFFLTIFFHFVNWTNGNFFEFFCFPSVNSTSSASFFGRSNFQYHKIDPKKKKKKKTIILEYNLPSCIFKSLVIRFEIISRNHKPTSK
jgi:hypothetical protein